MDDEVGGVAPISDEQIEKLELSFGYSDDDYESLVNAFRNAWPSIICRLRSQSAEIAELRQQNDELRLTWRSLEAEIWNVCSELGGEVEGRPTSSINYLQRIRELRRSEAELAEAKREVETLRSRISAEDAYFFEMKEELRLAKNNRDNARQNRDAFESALANVTAERDTLRAELERVRALRVGRVFGMREDGMHFELPVELTNKDAAGVVDVWVDLEVLNPPAKENGDG